MKRKTLIVSVLAVLFCFSFTIVTVAATLSPKDLALKSIDNMDLSYNQKFCEKSSGNVTYQINKLSGSSLKEVNIPQGISLDCAYKLDVPGEKSVFDVNLGYNNKTCQGEVYLAQDKLIITKSFLEALNELVPNNELDDLDQYPEYLYFSDPVITQMWTSMLDCPNAKVTEETKELIKFFVESIPEEYFHASATTVTLELDQAGFEETICLMLEKVKNEKERFADMIVTMATTYDTTGAMGDPQQMKADMIKGINEAVNSGSWPTKEQIQQMDDFIQVKQFKYQSSIIPGGQSKFDASLAFHQGIGFTGQMDINSESNGKVDNLTGTCNINLNVTEPGGTNIKGAFKSNFAIKGDTISQDLVISGAAKKANGTVDFDVEVTGKSTQKVESNLVVDVPALTAANSMDIEKLTNTGGGNATVTVPKGKTAIFVNNRVVTAEAEPFMQDNRLLVPIRFVAESLDCEVRWIDPNVIRITRGDQVISMFADEKKYILNGNSATMDTAPVLKNGRVFVPVRFVAEALNCTVNYEDNKVYINTK